MPHIIDWSVGLLVAVGVGHVGTKWFLVCLRKAMNLGEKPHPEGADWGRVPPWLTGVVERFFFAIAVGVNLSGAGTAMIGWLALKLATNWNHPAMAQDQKARSFALSAIVAGLVSMLFAVLGGLICKGLYACVASAT